MPRDMLIRYRGCQFLARKGHIEIFLLSPKSEPYALQVFDPDKGDVVVDMGAHAGKYTLPSAKLVGEEGRVFAFEAIPEHYEALKRNIEINGFSNVTTTNAATYDENRKMWLVGWDLREKPDPGHPACNNANPEGSMQVEAVTVDSVLEEEGVRKVDYVKIDIGRQELNALKGMKATLRESDEAKILIEIGEKNFEQVDYLLSNMGFNGTPLDDDWGSNGLRDYIYS